MTSRPFRFRWRTQTFRANLLDSLCDVLHTYGLDFGLHLRHLRDEYTRKEVGDYYAAMCPISHNILLRLEAVVNSALDTLEYLLIKSIKKVWEILFSRGEKPLNPAQFATCPPSVFRHSRQANSALSGPKFRAGGPKFWTGPIICTSSKFCLVLNLVNRWTKRVTRGLIGRVRSANICGGRKLHKYVSTNVWTMKNVSTQQMSRSVRYMTPQSGTVALRWLFSCWNKHGRLSRDQSPSGQVRSQAISCLANRSHHAYVLMH